MFAFLLITMFLYTVFQKTTLMLDTITSSHINSFKVIFGKDVAERLCYQMVICYPTSPN